MIILKHKRQAKHFWYCMLCDILTSYTKGEKKKKKMFALCHTARIFVLTYFSVVKA